MGIPRISVAELAREIKLPLEKIGFDTDVDMWEDEVGAWKKFCMENRDLFFEKVLEREHPRKVFLYIYLNIACECYSTYKVKGFSDKIYFDTFYDITRWCNDCYKAYGEYGIEEYGWLYNHVTMKIFQMGEFQFADLPLWEDMQIGDIQLKQGDKVFHLHIPKETNLNEEELKKSVQEVNTLLPGRKAILCTSWLLDPDLKQLLPEKSNIVKFQEAFTIYKLDKTDKDGERHLFGTNAGKREDYEERTSFQRKYKEYILNGGELGNGFGILKQ